MCDFSGVCIDFELGCYAFFCPTSTLLNEGGKYCQMIEVRFFFSSLFSSSSSTKISFILSALLCLSFYPPISASLLLFGQLYNNVWSTNHYWGAPLARAPCTEGCSGMGLSTPQANLLCYIPHLSPPLYCLFCLSQNKIFRINITLFVKLKAL